MNVENQINYIELPARDLEKIKQFYSATFGWGFTDYGDEYTAFSNAGLEGGFFKSEQSSDTASGSALIVLFSRELETVLATVIKNGGTISKEIFTFPGGRRFQFFDVSGNELAVWSDVGE